LFALRNGAHALTIAVFVTHRFQHSQFQQLLQLFDNMRKRLSPLRVGERQAIGVLEGEKA